MKGFKTITSVGVIGVSIVMLTACGSTVLHDSRTHSAYNDAPQSNTVSTTNTASSTGTGVSNQAGNATTTPTSPTSATIHTESYASTADAVQAVSKVEGPYQHVTSSGPLQNLGLGIKAKFARATGQYVYKWHEGNWSIILAGGGDSVPGTKMAKQVVAYLHSNMLPPPQKQGVILFEQSGTSSSSFVSHNTIAWQEGSTVHEITQSGDPINVLKEVVASYHKANQQTSDFHQVFVSPSSSGMPNKIYQEVFLSKNIGFSIKNLGGGMNSFKYEIDKTTNGGKTWTKQGTVGASHVYGVSFVNQKTGFFLDNSPAYGITPDLYVTHDGGAKWTEHKLPIPSKFKQTGNHGYYRESQYPIFFTSNVGVIPVYGFNLQKNQSGNRRFLYMLMTNDGGSTWKAFLKPSQSINWSAQKTKLSIHYKDETATIQNPTRRWQVKSEPYR